MRKGHPSALLYRLIYCSRNVIAPDAAGGDALEREIRAILLAARRNNPAAGITGALLFTGTGFAQALEGRREAVERAFERIGADPRHADVTVLSFTPTERRAFPDWPLGVRGGLPDGMADPLGGLLADAAAGRPRMTTGSDVLRLLERVVRREDQWIAA